MSISPFFVAPKVFEQEIKQYLESVNEQTKKKIMAWHKNGREAQNKNLRISKSLATPSLVGEHLNKRMNDVNFDCPDSLGIK